MRRLRDLAWVAGLLEGEGCFSCPSPSALAKGGSHGIAAICETTDRDVILKLADILHVGRVTMKSNKTVNGKTTWRWTAHGGQAVEVMLTLYPMMGERRKGKIAECMLYWRSIPLRRKWFKT